MYRRQNMSCELKKSVRRRMHRSEKVVTAPNSVVDALHRDIPLGLP
jgi:hypothetical protein